MLKTTLKMAVLVLVGISIGTTLVFFVRYRQVTKWQSSPFIPGAITRELRPPGLAITATLTPLVGSVTLDARDVATTSTTTQPMNVVQGESLQLDSTSSARLVLTPDLQFLIGPKADLRLTNLTPPTLLMWQQGGEVTYEASTSATTVTIRSLSLLTTIASATATLTVNAPKPNMITIVTTDAPITVAFQDHDTNTTVKIIPPGTTAIYNHPKRTLTLPKKTPASGRFDSLLK